MTSFRPGRFLGVTAGAVVILGLGVYGPATLLGPLPAVHATVITPPAAAADTPAPVLPAAGASALVVTAPTDTEPLALAGTAEPVPMASAAKLITALVVLDAKPLEIDGTGPAITISTSDYQDYLDYAAAGARTVAVFPGETWTERELLQALILGSSNNHADTIARWAFGSPRAYLDTANAWLEKQGLDNTHVVDTNGLHDESAGTAADLAILAGLAGTHPLVAELLAKPTAALAGLRGVDNTTEFQAADGITGVSRSYTDAAGVCYLFTATVGDGDRVFRFAGAFLGEPDYETLHADLEALMAGAEAGVRERPILAAGDAYATFEAPWGDTARGVVGASKTRFGWQTAAPGDAEVSLDTFATGRAGQAIGKVVARTGSPSGGDTVSSRLVLDSALNDPGPGWRLLNPIPVIAALLAAQH
jgi:D-alanyl-D-alanine carboxypeptidase (penicillin-binding protein 5/6)